VIELRNKFKAAILGAISVPVLVWLFSTMSVGTTFVTIDSQLTPFETNFFVKNSETIVIGTVKSVETKFVDESFLFTDSLTGESRMMESMRPYHYVTLSVEKYLKDKSGTTDEVTFQDNASGCTKVGDEQICVEQEHETNYNVGDRILVFISDVDGHKQVSGQVGKFDIKNGKMENLHSKITGKPAKDAIEFEKEIVKAISDEKSKSG